MLGLVGRNSESVLGRLIEEDGVWVGGEGN